MTKHLSPHHCWPDLAYRMLPGPMLSNNIRNCPSCILVRFGAHWHRPELDQIHPSQLGPDHNLLTQIHGNFCTNIYTSLRSPLNIKQWVKNHQSLKSAFNETLVRGIKYGCIIKMTLRFLDRFCRDEEPLISSMFTPHTGEESSWLWHVLSETGLNTPWTEQDSTAEDLRPLIQWPLKLCTFVHSCLLIFSVCLY